MRYLTLLLFGAMLMLLARTGYCAKIIEFGWDVPDTAYLRQHIKQMEKRPFDGVVLRAYGTVKGERKPLWQSFSKIPLPEAAFKAPLADLKATSFHKFTDNFLLAWATPGDCDWFNDADCAAFAHNMGLAARLAKQGGLKGLCFDPECYGKPRPWEYAKQAHKDQKSYAKYCDKVRQRGREVMRAMVAEYPDQTFFTLFGFTAVQRSLAGGPGLRSRLMKDWMSLYPAFLNGLLDEMPAQMRFVDGHEWGYYYTTRQQFADGYHQMLGGVRPLLFPGNWERYRAHISAGFGLYPDRSWRDKAWGWHVDDVSKNFYTPEKFAGNLQAALDYADDYVWVYTEAVNWWTGKDLPQQYVDVLEKAHNNR